MSFPGSRALSGPGFGGPSIQDQRLGARTWKERNQTDAAVMFAAWSEGVAERAKKGCEHPDNRLTEVNGAIYCCRCGETF